MVDKNLEFLATIHSVLGLSQDLKKAIDIDISNSDNGSITIPVEIAAAISLALEVQGLAVKYFTEENHEIMDRVEQTVNSLNKK